MKKNKQLIVLIMFLIVFTLTGCGGVTQASKVSYNLSQEADNFNVVREITVINCIQGDVLFQMSGRMSISVDESESQLEIIVENDNDTYVKHFIGLSDNVTYVLEDLNLGDNEVNNYKYTLNFNPKMWLPEIDTIE